MKGYADGKRTNKQFHVDDMIYLKLQTYKQGLAVVKKNMKLSAKLYGPFENLDKLVRYHTNLSCLMNLAYTLFFMCLY